MGDENEALEVVKGEAKPNEIAADEANKKPDEKPDEGEVEIVLDDGGSQPENRGVRRRINKLNAKVRTAEDGQSAATTELAAKTEENKLLRLALDQTKTSKAPNPNDFEGGASNAKFVEANDAYIQTLVDQGVQKAVSKIPTNEPVDTGLARRQEAHYERADKLGVKDFDAAEDEAISILGRETVNHIINASNKSELILFYFGKDKAKAEAFADLVASDPTGAAIEIGRLEERLKVKPLAKTQQADPDEELEGGTSTSDDAYQRNLDKLRGAAAGGERKHMDALMEFKRKHRKAA